MRQQICRLKLVQFILVILTVVAVHPGDAGAASRLAQPRCEMALQNGKLTAQVVEAPLREVLGELERLSGIQTFVSRAEGETRVSIDITDLPLAEAVANLVHGHSHALLYKGTQLTEIWVFSQDKGKYGRPTVDSEAVTEPYPSDASGEDIYGAPADAITAAALEAPDATARIQALRLLAERPADPSVTETLSAVAQKDDDSQVRAVARDLAAMR